MAAELWFDLSDRRTYGNGIFYCIELTNFSLKKMNKKQIVSVVKEQETEDSRHLGKERNNTGQIERPLC